MNWHRKDNMKKLILITALLYSSAGAWEPQNAPDQDHRALLAAVIIAEAGGEGRKGMEAVYEVIWQRASLQERSCLAVITQRKQFSCLNGVKHDDLIKRMSKHKHYEWVRKSLLIFPPLTVHTVPNGQEKVNRNRADHYFAHKVTKPYWSNGKGKVIGNHTFERHR